MYKTIVLIKRKPGMTFADFMTYYEGTHAKLGERVLPTADRYFRRYLTPYTGLERGPEQEPDYDVITEIWFKDRATFETAMSQLRESDIAKEIEEDEKQLFDRSRIHFFTVEECESWVDKT
jgi:uncharacterized protein (TIGR02118 family)